MEEQEAILTEHRRSLEKTISVLFKISDAVSHTRDLDDLYGVIHKALDDIFYIDSFFIALHDPTQDKISFPYYADKTGESPDEILNFSLTSTYIGKVIQSKTPMIFHGPGYSAVKKEVPSGGEKSRVWLGSPLIVKERVIGAMAIQSFDTSTSYHSEDLSLINSVSQHVALAIERKESEAKIKEQGQILKKILESSPVGIALVENRVFKWVNTELVRMFGYSSKQDLENKSVKMIYAAMGDFEFAGKTIYQGLSTTGKADYEMDMVKKDGSSFPVHVRLNSTQANDPMSWTIGTFTDISQRRSAEKEAVERERLQGVLEMAGAVCHEINQPLQSIIGYTELLGMDPEPAASKLNLENIKSQASRLGKITTTLANITQYKTVEYPGNTKIVDIWGASPPAMKEKES